MIFPLININTHRSVSDKIRLCFWLYLLLLIFEGALRKWFLPQLSNLFLVVREPIVLYVLYLSFKYNICRDNIFKVLFIFSVIFIYQNSYVWLILISALLVIYL